MALNSSDNNNKESITNNINYPTALPSSNPAATTTIAMNDNDIVDKGKGNNRYHGDGSSTSLNYSSSTSQPVTSITVPERSQQQTPPADDKTTTIIEFFSTDPFSLGDRRKSEEEIRRFKKKEMRNFYKYQNQIIDELLKPIEAIEKSKRHDLKEKLAIYGSMAANVGLCILQLYAAITSKSLALFATMVDSCMDLLSNGILLIAAKAANRKNILKYPTGKGKMETAGVIVFSSLMTALSVQILIEAIKSLANRENAPDVPSIAIACIGTALGVKFILYIYCRSLRDSASAQALAQDHRNDLLINSFGLTMSLLSSRLQWWIDPFGAIVISLYILRSWTTTAYEQIQLIVGKSADHIFLQRATYIALTHHPKILQIDTCRAYHSGYKLVVEIDIVMDRDTPLWESHDIGEDLQNKLEKLPNVDRAFVHVDYESDHKPEHQ